MSGVPLPGPAGRGKHHHDMWLDYGRRPGGCQVLQAIDRSGAERAYVASGVFTTTGSFDAYDHSAEVAVSLLPDTVHNLRVEARVQEIASGDHCVYGGYTISTDRDRYGAPLVIVQTEPTATVTPTLTPSPTPGPGVSVRGHVQRQGAGGSGVPGVMVLLSLAGYPPSASAFTTPTATTRSRLSTSPAMRWSRCGRRCLATLSSRRSISGDITRSAASRSPCGTSSRWRTRRTPPPRRRP